MKLQTGQIVYLIDNTEMSAPFGSKAIVKAIVKRWDDDLIYIQWLEQNHHQENGEYLENRFCTVSPFSPEFNVIKILMEMGYSIHRDVG